MDFSGSLLKLSWMCNRSESIGRIGSSKIISNVEVEVHVPL
jgi:hypothetical protein